jgi:hypothetical protein
MALPPCKAGDATLHSALMFAALMIGHHFSISAFCDGVCAASVMAPRSIELRCLQHVMQRKAQREHISVLQYPNAPSPLYPVSQFDRGHFALIKSMGLEAKDLNQLLHVLDLVSHKPAHLLRRAAGYNVAVFRQLRDQLWSTGCNHKFPI